MLLKRYIADYSEREFMQEVSKMTDNELERIYKSTDNFFWEGYQPLLSSFGTIVIQIEDNDYQGDSRILYNIGRRIGFLMFGWGSCSGCDAFYACTTFKQAEKFSNELEQQIKWFDSEREALEWFERHDWEGDYSGRDDNTKLFVTMAIMWLKNRLEMEEKETKEDEIINRQKAEIERLREINQFLRDNITGNAEITVRDRLEDIRKAKCEAIKEFGKLVINNIDDGLITHSIDIVNLVAEEVERIEDYSSAKYKGFKISAYGTMVAVFKDLTKKDEVK